MRSVYQINLLQPMTTDFHVRAPRLFSMGALYMTRQAMNTLVPEDIALAITRHHRGDWGDLSDSDRAENESALREGRRLFSAYHDRNRVKFWIITEADRSYTTVLLPDDY